MKDINKVNLATNNYAAFGQPVIYERSNLFSQIKVKYIGKIERKKIHRK